MKKKFFSLFTAVVLSSSIFIACNNEAETKTAEDSTTVSKEEPMAPPAEAPKDIVDVAAASADHSTLVAAVKAAGLVETLKGAGPFTVFAPTNAAFNALPAGTVSIKDGKVMIDGANVTAADLAASNGVIHVIDAVVTPKK